MRNISNSVFFWWCCRALLPVQTHYRYAHIVIECNHTSKVPTPDDVCWINKIRLHSTNLMFDPYLTPKGNGQDMDQSKRHNIIYIYLFTAITELYSSLEPYTLYILMRSLRVSRLFAGINPPPPPQETWAVLLSGICVSLPLHSIWTVVGFWMIAEPWQ
jgi:hypothetical protein